MNIYWLAMVVVTSVLGLIYEMNHRAEQSAQSVDVSMIARSVLVYRNAWPSMRTRTVLSRERCLITCWIYPLGTLVTRG